jgi:hypothetical protein
MSRSHIIGVLRSTTLALVTAIGLGSAGIVAAAASPEDEIARLDRLRAKLFEELVKTRVEAATARAERDAALKARDTAEAEITRLRQEAANARRTEPVPIARTKAPAQQRATAAASSVARRRSVRAVAPAATGSVPKVTTAQAPQPGVRASPRRRAVIRRPEPALRQEAPTVGTQELPSVLRLQDLQ